MERKIAKRQTPAAGKAGARQDDAPSVDIVIPVYNEEKDIPNNVPLLHQFLSQAEFPYRWRIVICDNGSTDNTPAEAERLASEFPEVEYLRLETKAKGLALKTSWLRSQMDIVSFMDADLSTDLKDFPTLISAVAHEGYDLAIGSRMLEGASVTRSWKRRLLTRGYNSLVRLMFLTHFKDAQCGFKAARREAAHRLLPMVKNENWFFDTELLILAEKLSYRIKELPVSWLEDERTSVRILNTMGEDMLGLARMRLTRPWRNAQPLPPEPEPRHREVSG